MAEHKSLADELYEIGKAAKARHEAEERNKIAGTVEELQEKWSKEIAGIKAVIDSPEMKQKATELDKSGEPVREIKVTGGIRNEKMVYEILKVMPEYRGLKLKPKCGVNYCKGNVSFSIWASWDRKP